MAEICDVSYPFRIDRNGGLALCTKNTQSVQESIRFIVENMKKTLVLAPNKGIEYEYQSFPNSCIMIKDELIEEMLRQEPRIAHISDASVEWKDGGKLALYFEYDIIGGSRGTYSTELYMIDAAS